MGLKNFKITQGSSWGHLFIFGFVVYALSMSDFSGAVEKIPYKLAWDNGIIIEPGNKDALSIYRWSMTSNNDIPAERHRYASLILLHANAVDLPKLEQGVPQRLTLPFKQVAQLTDFNTYGTAWSGSLLRLSGSMGPGRRHIAEVGPALLGGRVDGGKVSDLSQMAMVYTRTTVHSPEHMEQRIMFGYINDKGQFVAGDKPLFAPDDPGVEELGYDTSHTSKVIQAFRDPVYFKDPDGGEHLFFSAKYNAAYHDKTKIPGKFDPNRNSAIGHAKVKNGLWQLMPPISTGTTAAQFELPSMVHHDGYYYCFVLEADWHYNTKDGNASKRLNTLKLYRSKTIANGGQHWQPWGVLEKGKSTRSGTLLDLTGFELPVYGVTVAQYNGATYFSAFDDNVIDMLDLIRVGTADLVNDPQMGHKIIAAFRKTLHGEGS